jgi:ABC-type uncharacterized transport system auxiliary subunit
MEQRVVKRAALAVVLAALAMLAGCASQGPGGRESSITPYGTLDIGISREK